MPRYIFRIHNDRETVDEIGQHAGDLIAARRHAMVIAADYTLEPNMLGVDGGAIVVAVCDEAKRTLLTARLAFTVDHSG